MHAWYGELCKGCGKWRSGIEGGRAHHSIIQTKAGILAYFFREKVSPLYFTETKPALEV